MILNNAEYKHKQRELEEWKHEKEVVEHKINWYINNGLKKDYLYNNFLQINAMLKGIIANIEREILEWEEKHAK